MFFLTLIMITVSLVVVGITIYILYSAAFDENRERLVETAKSQARLIEAVARFDAAHEIADPGSYPEGTAKATLSQIIDAHRHYKGFGKTGEFTLARREGDNIVFLLRHRHHALEHPRPVPFDSVLAEPMRRALSGQPGNVVGLDYRGKTVLAAYEPVAELNLGIVAKIDLVEIREPFVRAGIVAICSALLVVLVGAVLFIAISSPMIRRLEESEARLQQMNLELEQRVEERTCELQGIQEQMIRKEKLAMLGQLAGGVGHELRNPLGVISNAIYYLQMTLTDAEETTKEYLDMISSEVRNSEKIVSDLLDLSRTKPAERERVEVSELIVQVLDRHNPPEEVQVSTEIGPDLPSVFVDPSQIGQVLDNLLTNAYQAMPEGGKLSIEAKVEEDRLLVSITDTGTGISQENIEGLFEPLFTTKARGTGLGLAVCKNLVEANGGSIEVESQEGKGSTFTVILPTRPDDR
jgi:signal transduction histidine kinase